MNGPREFSLILILFLSFFFYSENRPIKAPKRKPSVIKAIEDKIHSQQLSLVETRFLQGIFLGQKNLPRNFKQELSILGLNHILTPSGLHLSAILFFPQLFFQWIKRRKYRKTAKLLYSTLLILLCLLIQSLPGFFSIKRILTLKVFMLFFKTLPSSSLFFAFIAIDFFKGTFQSSPKSFALSFLFLGIFFTHKRRDSVFLLIGKLWVAQMVLACVFHQPFSIVSPFFNFLLSGLFSLLFPIYIFLTSFDAQTILSLLLRFFFSSVHTCSVISLSLPFISTPNIFLIFSFILCLLIQKKRTVLFCIPFIFLGITDFSHRAPDFSALKKIAQTKEVSIIQNLYTFHKALMKKQGDFLFFNTPHKSRCQEHLSPFGPFFYCVRNKSNTFLHYSF